MAENNQGGNQGQGANQGEGNRDADRRYRQGVQQHLKNADVAGEAQRAKDAVTGQERSDLSRAEEEGKRHAKGEDPLLKP